MLFLNKKSTKRKDQRGCLVDFLSLSELKGQDKIFGQIYYVTFASRGTVRGNHYHTGKKEWFVAIYGKLEVILQDVNSGKRVEFVLNGSNEDFQRIEIKENVAHAFRSISKTALLLNYCNKPYQLEEPDTIPYNLF